MTKWELTMYIASLSLHRRVDDDLWRNKDKEGKTQFDHLDEMAAKGWELVSVTPLTNRSGETGLLLFTFKRPIQGDGD